MQQNITYSIILFDLSCPCRLNRTDSTVADSPLPLLWPCVSGPMSAGVKSNPTPSVRAIFCDRDNYPADGLLPIAAGVHDDGRRNDQECLTRRQWLWWSLTLSTQARSVPLWLIIIIGILYWTSPAMIDGEAFIDGTCEITNVPLMLASAIDKSVNYSIWYQT